MIGRKFFPLMTARSRGVRARLDNSPSRPVLAIGREGWWSEHFNVFGNIGAKAQEIVSEWKSP